MKNKETVDHPDHYKGKKGLEAIDVIEEFDLGFCLGNTVKYILRANKKGNRLEDLMKARWYLEREIANAGPHLKVEIRGPQDILQSVTTSVVKPLTVEGDRILKSWKGPPQSVRRAVVKVRG